VIVSPPFFPRGSEAILSVTNRGIRTEIVLRETRGLVHAAI
jgi:hypothetical protein